MKMDRRVRRTRAGDTHHEDASEVFRRLGLAESGIGQLREQFVGFSTQLKHQDSQLATIEATLDSIANSMQARNATDWKALAAWATVILAVVALYTNLNLSPVKEALVEGRADRNDIRTELRAVTATQQRSIDSLVDAAEKRGRMAQRMDYIEQAMRDGKQSQPK